MTVNYYEIMPCSAVICDGKPSLLAPPDTYDPQLLMKYQFLQMPDGCWIHFLTEKEHKYLDTHRNEPVVTINHSLNTDSPEDHKAGNTLAAAGLGAFAMQYLLAGSSQLWQIMHTAEETASQATTASTMSFLSGIGMLCGIASFVLMLTTRIKYPNNTLGKILMWIFIIHGILVAAVIAIAMIAFLYLCTECVDGMQNCPG